MSYIGLYSVRSDVDSLFNCKLIKDMKGTVVIYLRTSRYISVKSAHFAVVLPETVLWVDNNGVQTELNLRWEPTSKYHFS